jgi:hypothetical protein
LFGCGILRWLTSEILSWRGAVETGMASAVTKVVHDSH